MNCKFCFGLATEPLGSSKGFAMMNNKCRWNWPSSGVIVLLILTGCGKQDHGEGAASPAGQVIAHVGTEDITAQELENEFALANIPFDKRTDELTKRMLGEIVLRKYEVQQAVAAKLDREPTVHLDIMHSREQVLAGALLQRTVAAKISTIGKSEVEQYIVAHPARFAKREIFDIDQISLPTSSKLPAIVEATKSFKSLEQVEEKLTEMGVSHSRSTGALDSGNIPDAMLTPLEDKKSDDIFFVNNGPTGSFFKVSGERPSPLTGDEAANRARQLIRMDLTKAAAEQSAKAALATAKYEGEYAKIMGVQPPQQSESAPRN